MERIGPYQVERELGRGGMGVVYLARDPRMDRRVALKLVTALDDAGGLRRFHDEGQAVARLRHPAIVTAHELGEHQGRPYLVLELVEGESLKDRLGRGPLEPRQAARLALVLAGALAHAHEQSILHRDVKPANVLIRPDGAPVLTDFGLARDVSDARERLTRTGEMLGTPAYMSPEQANGDRAAIGPATDVYGLGATLYAMLTGRPPVQGDGLVQLLNALLLKPPPPPSALQPAVPPELEAICLRCLEKDPAGRYPSAEALQGALAKYLAGGDPRPAAPRRLALVGGAVAALLVTALAVASGTREAPGAAPAVSTASPAPATAAPPAGAAPARTAAAPRPAARVLEREHSIRAPSAVHLAFVGQRLVLVGAGLSVWDLDGPEPQADSELGMAVTGALTGVAPLGSDRFVTRAAGEQWVAVRTLTDPGTRDVVPTPRVPEVLATGPGPGPRWIAIADGAQVWVRREGSGGDWRRLGRAGDVTPHVEHLVFSPDGSTLLAVCTEREGDEVALSMSGQERGLVAWRLADGSEVGVAGTVLQPRAATGLPRGWLVAFQETGSVLSYPAALGQVPPAEDPEEDPGLPGKPHLKPGGGFATGGYAVKVLARLSDGRMVVATGETSQPEANRISLWDPAGERWTERQQKELGVQHGESVRDVFALSPDERRIALMIASDPRSQSDGVGRVEVWAIPP